MNKILHYLLTIFIFLISLCVNFAEIQSSNILSSEKAFKVKITANNHLNNLTINILIEPNYYLYQSKFSFHSNPKNILDKPQFSSSITHSDEFFGTQQIFRHQAKITLPILNPSQQEFNFVLTLQGCADVGICYPPLEKHYLIKKNTVISLDNSNLLEQRHTNKMLLNQLINNQSTTFNTNKKVTSWVPAQYPIMMNDNDIHISWNNFFKTLFLFFLAGIAISLTACMYPLIPIVSSIIIKRHNHTRSFLPTLFYVQGIAITYTFLGILASFTGILLNIYLQQPIFIIPACILILILALSMLDVFQLQLPTRWQNRLNHLALIKKNNYTGLFLLGCISALIIGPCIAPPLAFALGYISTTKDVILGALSLYFMGLGMGVPLLIFSLFGDKFLPKSGNWMNVIKYLLGILLLFIAVYLASPFFPNWLSLIFYSLVFLSPLVIFLQNPATTRLGRCCYTIFSCTLVFLTCNLMINYWFGKDSLLNSYLSVNRSMSDNNAAIKRYTDPRQLIEDMSKTLKKYPDKPIYLDFYAEWCVACKKMEKYTFSDPRVKNLLNQNNFFQIDITDNTEEQRQLLKKFSLYAPPGFFILKAPNRYSRPLLGFEKPEEFLKWIEANNYF